jgi:hypothetical protein
MPVSVMASGSRLAAAGLAAGVWVGVCAAAVFWGSGASGRALAAGTEFEAANWELAAVVCALIAEVRSAARRSERSGFFRVTSIAGEVLFWRLP